VTEDVVVRTPDNVAHLTWQHVVDDIGVGLVDLDGHGTGALMNPAARELLHLLAGTPEEPTPEETGRPPRRGPRTVRGDLTELLGRYAPRLAETMQAEIGAQRSGGTGAPGPLAPGRVVSCEGPDGERWVKIDVYRRSESRFLMTLVDVTHLEQERAVEGAREWELADTVAQRLVTAETALDLGRHDLGRRLVSEARALIGARIGEQVRRTGGVAPGLMRRQVPSEDVAPPEGDT
jgi:hypothetical protein